MLSEKDRREYKQGIYDLYSEVGTTLIKYYPDYPNNSDDDDLYGEKENIYIEPISLVGVIEPLDPASNTLDPMATMGINLFTFDIPILSLEKANLEAYNMLKGHFEFENKRYNILDVTPEGMFTDFYTTFKFKARMI